MTILLMFAESLLVACLKVSFWLSTLAETRAVTVAFSLTGLWHTVVITRLRRAVLAITQ